MEPMTQPSQTPPRPAAASSPAGDSRHSSFMDVLLKPAVAAAHTLTVTPADKETVNAAVNPINPLTPGQLAVSIHCCSI